MLRTPLCDLLGIESPIIQGSLGPWSCVELVVAVSNAGGLGSLGTALLSPKQNREQIARTRQFTDKPFAVNHTLRPFNEEVFATTLQARPPVISFAHADPGELVKRAHDAGSLCMHMVTTVQQAHQAAQRGVDILIAQGSESAGFSGTVSTLALVPQVVDAVNPVPVVAAGGIADGRGLAAALVLGAQGINIGTRFLACMEATTISDDWKRAIVQADSQDTLKVTFAEYVFPPVNRPGGYHTQPRVLRTPFVEQWNQHPEEAQREAKRLSEELLSAIQQGRAHELVPFTGETAGLIHEILPAADIVRRIVAQAQEVLKAATTRFR
jgi:nitronate monooxygenase/enoyl-[acyl-carrier protein] reductase II